MIGRASIMSYYLDARQVNELADAILSGRLSTPDARDDLLSNIHHGYVATLPIRRSILDQIKSDLNELNQVPYLEGGEVPLRIWLENAVHRLRRSSRPEQAIFQRMLDAVAAKSQAAAPGAPQPVGQLERIIHQDDLLAFGWLNGAVAVGTAVARLVVPRYEHGTAVLWPGSDKAVVFKGTAWLLGPQHIITNHHVINARSESEPIASESDLHLQARATRVQFDYDFDGADETDTPVEDLVAWYAWDKKPALDYAILKLAERSRRRPLTLAPGSLAALQGTVMPVNIIQHPNGNPKAIGVRNNLTSTLEDHELRYFTDTMRGSSGSPVCNDLWQVVALHRAEYRLASAVNFQGKDTAWVNRGVRIDRLVDHLRSTSPELWSAIGAAVV